MLLAGIDIGGTKCAVSLGKLDDNGVTIIAKERFPTPDTPQATLAYFSDTLAELTADDKPFGKLTAIGISCGGPLDSKRGLILSPPNLPGWDRIDVVSPFRERFGVPVAVQNDANACALAEWRWGAGRGFQNVIFLTFGTGMGAGLILDGHLYSGTNDLAGEVGHIRLTDSGPVGYGKAGSFEGWCSGGGIAQLAQSMAREWLEAGEVPAYAPNRECIPAITAETVGIAAQQGDPHAIQVWEMVARKLGGALAILIDVLNPERIVIGSIYGRQQTFLQPLMLETLCAEALPLALSVCEVVPAGLGERVGDFAALSVAAGLI